MSNHLTISDKQVNNLNFNVRYEKLDKAVKPEITYKVGDTEVKERSVVGDLVILPGMAKKKWMDETGKAYSPDEITAWIGEEQYSRKEMTKVFDVISYEPVQNYTDRYVISKYYEVFPSDNKEEKDVNRQKAVNANGKQMRVLWEYLYKNNLVARGEFNTSSRGFEVTDGYIRAVLFDNKLWGLEIGVFKEEKVFEHLNETDFSQAVIETEGKKLKTLRRI